jgi:hypothetical protein
VSGVVEGGWEFVAAAYIVTGAVLSAYATSVFLRYKTEQRRAAAEAEREAGK